MKRGISLKHKLTGTGVCLAAALVQPVCNVLLLGDDAFAPGVLMIELPLPLVAGLLFWQSKADGAWSIITLYSLAMGCFWGLGGHVLLEEPSIFIALLLLSLGALGTYGAYELFHYLRRVLSPEYELMHRAQQANKHRSDKQQTN